MQNPPLPFPFFQAEAKMTLLKRMEVVSKMVIDVLAKNPDRDVSFWNDTILEMKRAVVAMSDMENLIDVLRMDEVGYKMKIEVLQHAVQSYRQELIAWDMVQTLFVPTDNSQIDRHIADLTLKNEDPKAYHEMMMKRVNDHLANIRNKEVPENLESL